MQVIAIVAGLIAVLVSNAFSFEFGKGYGTAARDAHWQKEIAAANVKAEALQTELNAVVRKKDIEIAGVLASKEQELKDAANDLENARLAQPLSMDCNKCLVPRDTLERVRQSRAAASDPKAGSAGAGAAVAPDAKGQGPVPAK